MLFPNNDSRAYELPAEPSISESENFVTFDSEGRTLLVTTKASTIEVRPKAER